MSNPYSVKYSQRFDEVVYSIYGDLKLFETLLSKNEHLLDKLFLEAGDTVYLIEPAPIKTRTLKEENLKSIW